MSFKAYVVQISNPAQVQILQDYLVEMEGVGWFSQALRVKKKIAKFNKDDIAVTIIVDRGNLRFSLVEEIGICGWDEVPFFTTLEALTEDGTIKGMTVDPKINLANLWRYVV